MTEEEYTPPHPLPLYGVVPGFGKCRVLEYHRNGLFFLLTKRDERKMIHRDRITFTNK